LLRIEDEVGGIRGLPQLAVDAGFLAVARKSITPPSTTAPSDSLPSACLIESSLAFFGIL